MPGQKGYPGGHRTDAQQVRQTPAGCTVGDVSGNGNGARLELLGPFEFTHAGSRAPLPLGAQRLLAYLALHDDGAQRLAAAEQLWPDCPPSRAAANLRSALCYARRATDVTLIDSAGQRLRLADSIHVDLNAVWDSARQVIDGISPLPDNWRTLIDDLGRELLPGWSDDWLLMERDRWDQMRVYALESLAQQFQAKDRYLPALQAAWAAIAIDPLRETAHRIVIDVHIAEGNVANALKRYHEYRTYLYRELKVRPSTQMTELVRSLTAT